ncbi:UNVERIFIED_CONTAM: hypothetical protein FKN15_040669 [Acipenser sinensis]
MCAMSHSHDNRERICNFLTAWKCCFNQTGRARVSSVQEGCQFTIAWGCLHDAARGRLHDAARGRLHDAARGRLHDAARGRLHDAARERLHDAAWGRLHDAAWGRLHGMPPRHRPEIQNMERDVELPLPPSWPGSRAAAVAWGYQLCLTWGRLLAVTWGRRHTTTGECCLRAIVQVAICGPLEASVPTPECGLGLLGF